MLRWSYLVPRLLILVLVCLFLRFGLDGLVHRAVRQGAESALGAKVEIGDLATQLVGGTISLSDVKAANPSKPLSNLFSFERSSLELDANALLHRRLVVTDGVIRGLQFDTARDTSGALPNNRQEPASDQPSQYDQYKQKATELCEQWLDDVTGRLQRDLADEFESVRLAEQLAERWPREYDALQSRIKELKSRGQELQRLVEEVRANPLDHLAEIPEHAARLQQVRAEITALRFEIERLGTQILVDKQAIEIAKQHDLERIRELARLDDLDPQSLTEYLLGDALNQRVALCRVWFDRLRTIAAYVAGKPQLESPSGRGLNVWFDHEQHPSVLFRRLALSGKTRVGERDLQFAGQAEHLTHQPRLHGQPAVLNLATRGAFESTIKATVDQTGDRPTYRLVAACPRFDQPKYQLGAEQLSVAVLPATAAVWLDVRIVDEDLTGEIRWRQDGVQLRPIAGHRLAGSPFSAALRSALGEVDRLHAAAQLSGTLQRPTWQLRSNLGAQLAGGIRSATEQQLQILTDKLIARAEQEVTQHLTSLDETVRTNALLDLLSSHEELISGFEQQLATKLNMRIGDLPFKKLFAN